MSLSDAGEFPTSGFESPAVVVAFDSARYGWVAFEHVDLGHILLRQGGVLNSVRQSGRESVGAVCGRDFGKNGHSANHTHAAGSPHV